MERYLQGACQRGAVKALAMRLGRVARSKPGKAAWPCGAVKDRECGSAVWCGQSLAKPLGRVAAKVRECGSVLWCSESLTKPLGV
ncbi:hypothetical protein JNUCC32_02530 [Paenibacillus sp. JNUCC32]|uniref:hypothetical protein n=1 Tax=Paenibacillus sp. JNUCC32 TaxID=2777984 RepID=UPI001787FD02|nr:hypothetical protein [Paenibacillus sp. JNUCC-32]QOT10931.1 hypothetical protein JNUCC32_02530 [Paenibacillus sp. JNUCC-32]